VPPGGDAAVVRLRLGERERFIAVSNDCNGRYCYLNPYRGAQIAMIESLRNLVCTGAVPLAMTDNLNFGNPYKPEVFYTLRECVRGLADTCRFFDVPVVGGNVSLYNESPEGAIDPTPTVAVVGLIAEEAHITRPFVRGAGQVLVLLGGWPDELGGSQVLGLIHGLKTGDAPAVDLAAEQRLQGWLLAEIAAGRIAAAHDLSEGGLLVAVSEMLFGPGGAVQPAVSAGDGAATGAGTAGLGAALELTGASVARLDALLFGESQGRVVVAVADSALDAVRASAERAAVPAQVIGAATADGRLAAALPGGAAVAWPVAELRRGWETSIETAMARPRRP